MPSTKKSHPPSPDATSRRSSRCVSVVCVALVALWTVDACRVLWQGWQLVVTPTPTCNTEMHIVDAVRCVAERRDVYPVVDDLPYVFHFYNPLTYLPAGIAGEWISLDLDGLLVAGRLLPFASALGIAALLAWFVRQQTDDALAAAMAPGLLFFFHASTLTDFFRNRPETPAILLSLGGWAICQRRPPRWWLWAAGSFAAAIALKQTFVAAPVACGLCLLWQRSYRDFARLTLATTCLVALTAAVGYFWMGHGYFEHTLWAMRSNPFDPVRGSAEFFPLLVTHYWGLLVPAVLIAAVWLHRRALDSGLVAYLLVCFALTTLLHGKLGADLNYHGELSVLMVLCVATALARTSTMRPALHAALVALLAVATLWPLVAYGPGWNDVSLSRVLNYPHGFEVPKSTTGRDYAARYRGCRDRALILDDEIAVRVGRPMLTDWLAATILFDNGRLDFRPIEDAIRTRQLGLIILRKDQRDRWAQTIYHTALASGYWLAARNEQILELRPIEHSGGSRS